MTEACWALLATQPEPIVPDEIVLLATRVGADLAQRLLGESGRLARLYQEWAPGVKPPRVSLSTIEASSVAIPAEDVDSNEAALASGEAVFAQLAELAKDDSQGILALLSGGRKTMAYHVGLAFSLYARAGDRLLHVIVPPAYERAPSFYYPSREQGTIVNLDGVRLDAAARVVTLIDVPYVRLSAFRQLLGVGAELALSVRAVNDALNPILTLETVGSMSRFVWGGVPLDLRPSSTLLLSLLVRRVVEGDGWLAAPRERQRDQALGAELIELARAIDVRIDRRTIRATRSGVDTAWLRPRLSRLNSELNEHARHGVIPISLFSAGRSPRRYRISIDARQVDPEIVRRVGRRPSPAAAVLNDR